MAPESSSSYWMCTSTLWWIAGPSTSSTEPVDFLSFDGSSAFTVSSTQGISSGIGGALVLHSYRIILSDWNTRSLSSDPVRAGLCRARLSDCPSGSRAGRVAATMMRFTSTLVLISKCKCSHSLGQHTRSRLGSPRSTKCSLRLRARAYRPSLQWHKHKHYQLLDKHNTVADAAFTHVKPISAETTTPIFLPVEKGRSGSSGRIKKARKKSANAKKT